MELKQYLDNRLENFVLDQPDGKPEFPGLNDPDAKLFMGLTQENVEMRRLVFNEQERAKAAEAKETSRAVKAEQELKRLIDALTARVVALEEWKATAETRIAALESWRTTASGQISTLQSQVSDLQSQV